MVIFINQIRMKIGVMFGNPETTTGGNALALRPVRSDIRRIGSIKKGDEVVGNETRVKVVKNKVAPPFAGRVRHHVRRRHLARRRNHRLGVAANVVDKSGAWYSYNGNRIGQGKDNVREYLKEHRELAIEKIACARTRRGQPRCRVRAHGRRRQRRLSVLVSPGFAPADVGRVRQSGDGRFLVREPAVAVFLSHFMP